MKEKERNMKQCTQMMMRHEKKVKLRRRVTPVILLRLSSFLQKIEGLDKAYLLVYKMKIEASLLGTV